MQNASRRLKLRKFALAKWKCAKKKKKSAARLKMPVARLKPKRLPSARLKKTPRGQWQKQKPKRPKKSARHAKPQKPRPLPRPSRRNPQSGPLPVQTSALATVHNNAQVTVRRAREIARHAQVTVLHGPVIVRRAQVTVLHALGIARHALGIARHALVVTVQVAHVQQALALVVRVRELVVALPRQRQIRLRKASQVQKRSSQRQNVCVRKIRTASSQPSRRAMTVVVAA